MPNGRAFNKNQCFPACINANFDTGAARHSFLVQRTVRVVPATIETPYSPWRTRCCPMELLHAVNRKPIARPANYAELNTRQTRRTQTSQDGTRHSSAFGI